MPAAPQADVRHTSWPRGLPTRAVVASQCLSPAQRTSPPLSPSFSGPLSRDSNSPYAIFMSEKMNSASRTHGFECCFPFAPFLASPASYRSSPFPQGGMSLNDASKMIKDLPEEALKVCQEHASFVWLTPNAMLTFSTRRCRTTSPKWSTTTGSARPSWTPG